MNINDSKHKQIPRSQRILKAWYESSQSPNRSKFIQKKHQDEVTKRLMCKLKKDWGFEEVQTLVGTQTANTQKHKQDTEADNISKTAKEFDFQNFSQNQSKYELQRKKKLAELANSLEQEELSKIKRNPEINPKSK